MAVADALTSVMYGEFEQKFRAGAAVDCTVGVERGTNC